MRQRLLEIKDNHKGQLEQLGEKKKEMFKQVHQQGMGNFVNNQMKYLSSDGFISYKGG